jgi:hypothetical protein
VNEGSISTVTFVLNVFLSVIPTTVKMQVRPTLVFTTSRLDEDIMDLLKANSKASSLKHVTSL